jgi:hypothetical protein
VRQAQVRRNRGDEHRVDLTLVEPITLHNQEGSAKTRA